jgi:acetoin utilization protein AcuB
MRVRERMSRRPLVIPPETDVATARRLLHTYGFRHLPVVDEGRVVGLVSERDIRLSQVAFAPPTDVVSINGGADIRVAEIMTTPAPVISSDEHIQVAARVMLTEHVGALPVVDDGGVLEGIVTTSDCLLASLGAGERWSA